MKRILTSAGVAVVGVSSLQAINAPDWARTQTDKPWTITTTVRAFYDDNYTTSPQGIPGPGGTTIHPSSKSFGLEVRPSINLALPLDQTFIGLGYTYSGKFFEDRTSDQWDHSHEFNARLDHRFNERFEVDLSDSFVITQEPTVVDTFGGIITSPTRTSGDSIRNAANFTFRGQLTHLLGVVVGYGNNLYSYDQTGIGSRSALLDRMEHSANIDLRFVMTQKLVGFVGYQYGVSEFTGNTPLYLIGTFPGPFVAGPTSSSRDSQSHYGYLGAEYTFNSQWIGMIRAGVQSTSYDSFPSSSLSPYVDLALTYTYRIGGTIQGGFKHARNATDIVQPAGAGNVGQPTLDQETSAVYASISQQFGRNLTASLLGQYQSSTFNGGAANNGEDNIWLIGLNFDYRINKHLSLELGYNFDRLESDLVNRSFTRNRVYMGVRGTY